MYCSVVFGAFPDPPPLIFLRTQVIGLGGVTQQTISMLDDVNFVHVGLPHWSNFCNSQVTPPPPVTQQQRNWVTSNFMNVRYEQHLRCTTFEIFFMLGDTVGHPTVLVLGDIKMHVR